MLQFVQLQRLLELRDFCEQEKENKSIRNLVLNDAEWLEVLEIVEVLQPFCKYTTKLQNTSCTLSDFFGYWTTLQLKMKSQTSPLKQCLLEHMAKYETDLMDNPLVIAALYFDPRYQRVLSADKKKTAILILKNIHQKIQTMEKPTEPASIEDMNNNEDNDDSNSFDGLMQYIDSLENNVNDRHSATDVDIDEAIRSFDGTRSTVNISALKYWESIKTKEPILYSLSQAIYCIAPTQSSVERSFSSLPVVLTARRTSIDDRCLRNILLIKNNTQIC